MLPTVAELRERAGGLDNLTDEQIASAIFETYGPMYGAKSFEEFAPQIGYEPNWDLGRGFQMAGRQIVGGGLRLGAKAAEAVNAPGVGRWLDEAADNQFNRSRQLSRGHDDITNVGSVGEAIDWAQQGIGQLGAYALPSIVGGGIGGAVGARGLTGLAARQAAVRGAAAGSAALNYPVQTGLMYEDLREQGIDDLGRAAAYAVPATALDLLGEVGAVSRVLTRPATGGLRRRVTTEVGRGVAAEVPTELGQTAIERYSAYKDLTGDEAAGEYINAAALAGLGGGARGVAAGLVPRRQEEAPPPPTFGDARSDRPPVETQYRDGQGMLFDPEAAPPAASFQRPEQTLAAEQEIRSLLTERGQLQSGMRAAEQAGDARQFYTFADAVTQIDARLEELSGALMQMRSRGYAEQANQPGLFAGAAAAAREGREYDLLSQAADDIGATRQLVERAAEDQFIQSQVGRVPAGSQLGLFGPAAPQPFGQPEPPTDALGRPITDAVGQAIADPRQGRLEFDPRALPYDPSVPSGPGGVVNPNPLLVTPQGEVTNDEQALFDRRYAPQDYVPPAPIGVENQTDMFGGAAPTPAPVAAPGPQVAQADPRQRAMFDQRGQPTYDAETQAQDDQIADQAAAYFSVKRTAKRDPYLVELGRMVFDGEITDDDAVPVVDMLSTNKYGQVDKNMAELRAQIAEARAAEAAEQAAAARAAAEQAKPKRERAPKAAKPAEPAKPAATPPAPPAADVAPAAEPKPAKPKRAPKAAQPAPVEPKPAPAPEPERMSDEELEARQAEIDQIVTDNTRTRVEGKLDDLQLDPDAKKSKVVAYARKLRKEGVLTDANVAEVERLSKDRDMGVDDLVEEIRTTVRVRNDETFGRTPAEPEQEAQAPKQADPDDIVAAMNGEDSRSPAQRWNDEALDDDPKFKDLPSELKRQWKDAVEDGYANAETQTRIIGVYKQRKRVEAQDARAEAEDQGDAADVEPTLGPDGSTVTEARKEKQAATGTLAPKATTTLRKANTLMARLINTNAGTNAYFIALRDVVLARESDKVDPEAMTVLDQALSLVPAEDAATARAEVERGLGRELTPTAPRDTLEQRADARPPRVRWDGETGMVANESVSASMRRIAEDDDFAFDHPDLAGAVLIQNISRDRDGATGRASEVLRAVTDWADQNNETLALVPAARGALSTEQLRDWYARNGFVERRGGAMVRKPKAVDQGRRGFLGMMGAIAAGLVGVPSVSDARPRAAKPRPAPATTPTPEWAKSGIGAQVYDARNSIGDILGWIAQNGSSEDARALAAQLQRLMPVDRVVLRLAMLNNSYGVARLARKHGAIEMLLDPGHGGVNEQTILHESVHAVIMARYDMLNYYLANRDKLGPNREADAAIKQYMEVFREFRQMVNRDPQFAKGKKPVWLAAPFEDPDEFITYALTNPEFQSYLKAREYKGKTLWAKLVDAVKSLLGLAPSQPAPTWLDAAMTASKQILDAAEKDAPDFEAPRRMQLLFDKQAVLDPKTTLAQLTQDIDGDQPRSFKVPETLPARNIKQRLADLITDYNASGTGLGLITLRQLGEIYKTRPAVRRFVDLTNKMITRARQLQGETFKIDTKWRALDDAVSLSLQRLMVDVTLAGVHPDVPVDDKANSHLTDKQKALHPELSKRYRELVQKDPRAAEVYAEAKAKMRADWDERGRLLRQAVINAYKPSLGPYAERGADIAKPDRDAFAKTLPGRSARAEMRQLWEDLDDHAARVNSIPGPYFPLVRFGRHVVTVKSARYIELSEQLTDARALLREAMDTVEDKPSPEEKEAIDEARKEVRRLTQAIEVIKENESDYLVEFYEKKSEAEARAAQLRAAAAEQDRPELTVAVRMREEYARQLDSASPMFMKRLEDAIKSNLPTKDATAVERAVRDLIIQSMPERSALKSELRRLNVKGAQAAQMRRAFAAASIRNSWHLSRLEYGAELNETLTELRTGDDDTNKVIGDELAKRYVQSMTFETGNEFFNKLGQLSYVTYLGMSPSFLLMNMAQPWIVSAPVMAARHGIGASAKQVGAASMEVGRAMRASFRQERDQAGSALKAARFELDLAQFSNPQERAMLEDLFDQGIIDITFEHDVGAVASGRAESWWDKSVELVSLPAHHTEVINRVATALAAYRLERAKGTPDAAARAYAERIVHETHLDYTPENAPRLFNQFGSLGRLVLQFKKYGQGMMYLLAKNLSAYAKGDKEAGKTLGYVLGMQLSVAGLAGLPGAWVVGMAASALAALSEDDDEPDFKLMFENALRDVLGDTVADSLIKGLPAGVAGVNVSNRIGMGDLGNPTAFVRDGLQGREWWQASLVGMLGPAASMVGNWAEAAALAADDPIKAAGTALPKVIADGLKAYDASTGGVRTRSGNVLVPAEEFTGWQTAVRGLGFQPTELTNMYERRAAFERAKQNRDEARNRLIRKYVEAKAGGGDVAAVQEKITGFNERHPDARITFSTLRKAEVSRRQYQKDLVDGVRVTKRDRELAERMGVGQ